MRGGAALGGAETLHAGGVDLGRDGRCQVVGQQDGVIGQALGEVAALVALAQQVAQHAQAHVFQVGRAGGQGGVLQLALGFDAVGQAVLPGPGSAVTVDDAAGDVTQPAGVAQQLQVGLEDVGLLGMALALGVGDERGQLALGIGQGMVQVGSRLGHAVRVVFDFQFLRFGQHQSADDQAGSGGNAAEGVAGFGFPVAQLAAQALGLRLLVGGQPGLAGLFVTQQLDGAQQGTDGVLGVLALGRDAQARVVAGTQAQQRGHAAGIGHDVAAAHAHLRLEAADALDPLAGRAGVQAVGVAQGDFLADGEVLHGRGAGGGGGGLAGQGLDEFGGVGGGEEFLQPGVVTHQAGEATQHLDVLVGGRCDAHDQVDDLGLAFGVLAPHDPIGHLQHGQAGALDEVLVVDHAVWNGDALSQEGGGGLLTLEQAVGEAVSGKAGLDQQTACSPHGVVAVLGRSRQLDFDRGVFRGLRCRVHEGSSSLRRVQPARTTRQRCRCGQRYCPRHAPVTSGQHRERRPGNRGCLWSGQDFI